MVLVLSNILLYFNLILIPVYCFKRIRNSVYTLVNPCFYFVLFCYIYLTFSSFILNEQTIPIAGVFKVSENALEVTGFLCNWFTIVAFFFYLFSKDKKLVPVVSYTPKPITKTIALVCIVISTIIALFLLATYTPRLISIWGQPDQREQLAKIFDKEIWQTYRLGILNNLLIASTTTLVWSKKNFTWYFFLFPVIILESLFQGRSLSFTSLIFAYISYVCITKKVRLLEISIALLTIISIGLIRLGVTDMHEDLTYNVAVIFLEAIITRFNQAIVYDNFINNGDFIDYLLNSSIAKLLPGKIAEWLFSNYSDFGYIEFIWDRYGSVNAGSIISESLFYGGVPLALITPFIMGGIFNAMNYLRIIKTFPGFIYMSFLISTQFLGFMRIGFYQNFAYGINLMFTYLSWLLFLEWGKVVFAKPTWEQKNILLRQPKLSRKNFLNL